MDKIIKIYVLIKVCVYRGTDLTPDFLLSKYFDKSSEKVYVRKNRSSRFHKSIPRQLTFYFYQRKMSEPPIKLPQTFTLRRRDSVRSVTDLHQKEE